MESKITIPGIDQSGRLYPIEKLEAHRAGGLLHLAISIFVFSRGRLLIQRRAAGKYHSGGLWANTCCTHPDWGEELQDAAHRRLREELCLEVPRLERRAVIDYHAQVADDLWERERVHVFEYATDLELPDFLPNTNEVAGTRLVCLADLRAEMGETPEIFAPWFRIYVARWNELGLTEPSRSN